MAKLILATAEGQQAIDLRPMNSLGRHPNNTIQLLDKIVSKEHCLLELRDGRFLLRDLGSLNGTYINGERVRGEQFLKHGDEISLGSTRARYDDGSGVPLPLPPVSAGAVQNPGFSPTGTVPYPTTSPWQHPGAAGPYSAGAPPAPSVQQPPTQMPAQQAPPSTGNMRAAPPYMPQSSPMHSPASPPAP